MRVFIRLLIVSAIIFILWLYLPRNSKGSLKINNYDNQKQYEDKVKAYIRPGMPVIEVIHILAEDGFEWGAYRNPNKMIDSIDSNFNKIDFIAAGLRIKHGLTHQFYGMRIQVKDGKITTISELTISRSAS